MTREEFAEAVSSKSNYSDTAGLNHRMVRAADVLALLDEYERSQWQRPEEWSGEARYVLVLHSTSQDIRWMEDLTDAIEDAKHDCWTYWRELPPGPKEGE